MWNVAIIGCGLISFGKNIYKKEYGFNHFDTLNMHQSFEVTCVSDNKNKILSKLDKYEKIKKYKFYKNLLRFNKIDLVVIATNTESHLSIINEIIKKKVKIALIEKPLSNKIEELNELVRIKSSTKTKIVVNYQRQFSKFFNKYKNIINKESVKKIKVNYSRGLFNNGSHFIDLFIWYFGLPQQVIKKNKVKKIKNDFICNFIFVYSGFKIEFHGNNKKIYGNNFLIILKDKFILYEKNLIKIYKKKIKNKKNFLIKTINDSDNIFEVYNYLNLLLNKKVSLKSSINDSIKIHKVVKTLL